MNVAEVIANLKEQDLDYKVEYKPDYPPVVERILVKIDGEYVLYEDKYYLVSKKEWVQNFYSSCLAYCPESTEFAPERVLKKVVEELYEMRTRYERS